MYRLAHPYWIKLIRLCKGRLELLYRLGFKCRLTALVSGIHLGPAEVSEFEHTDYNVQQTSAHVLAGWGTSQVT